MTALDRAIADIGERMNATFAALHETAVRRMLSERWRITAAIWPSTPWTWPPVNGASPVEMLTECRMLIRGEASRLNHEPGSGFGAAPGDPVRLRTPEAAEAALIEIVAGRR